MSRPLQNAKIEDLEALVESSEKMSVKTLRSVIGELRKRRSSRRNLVLTNRAETLLASLTETSKPVPVTQQQKGPANLDHPAPDPVDGTNQLPTHLVEFVTALKDEIEAAKRSAASSAYLLTEGRLIAPVGSGFHYRFQSQRQLRVPPDTPGEYRAGGDSRGISVVIVETRDLEIVIETPEKLSPAALQGKLITDLSMLLMKLIERIETKGLAPQSAANRILGFCAPQGDPRSFTPIDVKLNIEQRQAVSAVLGQDTLFLWGPPGTGKTQTIGEIGAQLFQCGKTLLLVSHTNTAVDEALLRIAQSVDGIFKEGDILRLGEPVKEELCARPDLILKRVAEKRSIELNARKKAAEISRLASEAELEIIHRKVELCEWLADVEIDLKSLRLSLAEVDSAQAEHSQVITNAKKFSSDSAKFQKLDEEARVALHTEQKLASLRCQIPELRKALLAAEKRQKEAAAQQDAAESILIVAEAIEPLRMELRALPEESLAKQQLQQASFQSLRLKGELQATEEHLAAAKELLLQTQAVGAIKRMWHKLPKPEDQSLVVDEYKIKVEASQANLQSALISEQRANSTYHRITILKDNLFKHAHIPELAIAKNNYFSTSSGLDASDQMLNRTQKDLHAAIDSEQEATARLQDFLDQHGLPPSLVIQQASDHFDHINELLGKASLLAVEIQSRRQKLTDQLTLLLLALRAWRLVDEDALGCNDPIVCLRQIETARDAAQAEINMADMLSLSTERDRLSAHVEELINEMRSIEDALKRVEEDLLTNVRVLATTLTRAFMRNAIQERVFDTVLVDESSMAPIPALWASATLAERCIVAVGDFKQLPPIVQSDHPLALRWLGRDVFAASGVQGAFERHENPKHFVALKEQHRMHPDISSAVNELVYKGILRDGPSVTDLAADESINDWYSADIKATPRVTLIDTSDTAAWNTTCDKSRFNILSALSCFELVKSWFSPQRTDLKEGSKKRVLLIAPYRPQAKLMDIMIRTEGLDNEIVANTVHSFQGSEADAVVVDLVADDPHFKVGMFMSRNDESNLRLLNVAITRAKRRLIIIADLNWFKAKGAGSFIGKHLLPWFEQRHRPFPMIQVMASRVGCAAIVKANLVLPSLIKQARSAQSRVIIFSPTLNDRCLTEFFLALVEARTRSVRWIVVTGTFSGDRDQSDIHQNALRTLKAGGATIILKPKMLEKMVLVDHSEVWAGSFPLLDEAPASGFYIRRTDPKFAAEVADMHSITAMIGAYNPEHVCPACSAEMTVANAQDGKPYYWKCLNAGCYSRDFDAPAPVDGILLLKCGSKPEFGYWGEVPHWLCTCGQAPSHRFKIHGNHLKLPKMKALIPARSLMKVCRTLGIEFLP